MATPLHGRRSHPRGRAGRRLVSSARRLARRHAGAGLAALALWALLQGPALALADADLLAWDARHAHATLRATGSLAHSHPWDHHSAAHGGAEDPHQAQPDHEDVASLLSNLGGLAGAVALQPAAVRVGAPPWRPGGAVAIEGPARPVVTAPATPPPRLPA